MDFELPRDVKMIQATIRGFVERELIPVEMTYPEGEELPDALLKPLQEQVRGMGFWLLDVPKEFGGPGLSLLARCAITEEVARTVALPLRDNELFGPKVGPILYECNAEQRERFLYPLLRGERRACFAQAEPEAGSESRSSAPRWPAGSSIGRCGFTAASA